MAFDDPGKIDLGALFCDAGMFDSRRSWAAAGFQIVNRAGKILVAQHPAVRGLLFKKYTSEVPEEDQTQNFERRTDGSRRLRAFVSSRNLSRIAVPQKWILDLPRHFPRKAHLLVVEQLPLSGEDAASTYQRIDLTTLHDLCVVLHHYRGMDSNVKNLPFTTDGRIALVDTEHWDRRSRKSYLHQIEPYLSRDRRKLAEKIFKRLEDDEDPRGLVDRYDFDQEEPTSSSSSASSSS